MRKKCWHITAGLILLVGLSACFSVKPSTSRSGGNRIQTFYVGDEGMQYFIKPMSFKSCDKEGGEILLDFTFRIKTDMNTSDSATFNFSIFHDKVLKNADRLEISEGDALLSFSHLDLMYTEFDKGKYKSRYSGKADLMKLRELFRSEDWKLTYFEGDIRPGFCPTAKARKTIRAANDRVFALFDE